MRRHRVFFAASFVAAVLVRPSVPAAQQPRMHLNPMIAKLAQGTPVFGGSTSDLSIENAHAMARADIDYIYVDMEHGPMNFEALRNFLVGMVDKAAILKKGNAQPNVAPLARFAPYGREGAMWVTKQALDVGLMGVILNGIDNKDEAMLAIRSMRYPQLKGSARMEPFGLRGFGPANASWFWGIPTNEYVQHADLWPLNPDGDLLAIVMIETVEGLQNLDAIASVPGVGGFFIGVAADLSQSVGVPLRSPESEAAIQRVLKACLDHHIACGMTIPAADMPKRIKEGWTILGTGGAGGGLTPDMDAALRAGRAALR